MEHDKNQKQNLEELITALTPYLKGNPKQEDALIIYGLDRSQHRPTEPTIGWLSEITNSNVNLETSVNSYYVLPISMIVKVAALMSKETVYKHTEGWEDYNTAVDLVAKEAADNTRRKYLKLD